jgi:Fe-S-cluster containining protein
MHETDTACHPPRQSDLHELERQVERGSMFTQAVFQKGFTRLSLVEAMVGELVDTLLTKGVVAADDLPGFQSAAAEATARAEEAEQLSDVARSLRWPNVSLRVDPEAAAPTEEVDCGARMHICHAVCCKLRFALTNEEVEAGVVKWDIGHPYVIRQSSNGYCAHNDAATGGCTVYEQRPALCRRFSCKGDARIWKDFDNMVLNDEWIDAHVGRPDTILLVDADATGADGGEGAGASVPAAADVSFG